MNSTIIFAIAALLAEILGTVGGFGSSLFFVPVASYFFDLHSVLGITALFHLASNISKIAMFRKGFDRQLILTIGIPAVICVIAGAFLSKYVPSGMLEVVLAVFLVVLSLILLLMPHIRIKASNTNAITGGVLSGFIAGLLGTGGAIRGITLAAFGLSTEVFIATSAIIDLFIDASRSVVYAANGYMHRHDLYLVPILLVVSIAGTWIGKQILAHISETRFRSIVLLLVLGTGIFTLFRAFTSGH